MTKKINEFPGVEVKDVTFLDAISDGARNADRLSKGNQSNGTDDAKAALLDSAFSASMLAVNALLAASDARCRLNPPPPAKIEIVTDETGKLIYRCQHKSPHRWRLDGGQL